MLWFKITVCGAKWKTDTGYQACVGTLQSSSTNNKLSSLTKGCLLSANWWMVGFPRGKCSFTSNLFHLFWRKYPPPCLWLVDYLCPASLAASPDRHAAISHLTIWTQPPHWGWHLWDDEVLCGPLGTAEDREASSSQSVSLETWFDGITDPELNHGDIIQAKHTDVINPTYLVSNG